MDKGYIKTIEYLDILPVWTDYLWPNRTSPIESNSGMLFLEGHTIKNMFMTPTFFGYFIDDKLAGVNSGHMCLDKTYRSRGLYVFPEYRGRGIGKELLIATIEQGFKEAANFIWSYPRNTSWSTYEAAGFIICSEWYESEQGLNAFCAIGKGQYQIPS